ncbi:MAG: wax ester/triacylglycerol synthase family O-acyltransferase [Burkholderiales bacterium]|nr:wax ester/triacylglycerol synthase family O-acyltransferase [Burkholderiales bacterium]
MSRVDTAWLRMDNDVNLMMIVGVWLLRPAVTLAALRERIADKLLKYPRFRCRVEHDAIGASWIPDPEFSIEHQVPATPLHRRRGETERQALQRLCGELATTPLDPQHPLWQFHLVEHYEGGSALIARIHHCIGDGIALISVMHSITDGGSEPPRRRRRTRDAEDWLADEIVRPVGDLAAKALAGGASDLARAGVHLAADAAALLLMSDDSPTLLKGAPAGRKVVAWGEPLPLDRVKAVSRGLSCTINDLLLTCVAGAIGDYLKQRGEDPAGQEVRAMVPVNLRPLEQAWQLGNHFGLAPVVLPVGVAHPLARLQAVRRRMGELKGSYQPLLSYAVLAVSGLLVKPAQDFVLNLFSKKTTAVMTNVPGPVEPLRLCGSTMRQSLFWVPASGAIGVGVSILSYGGGVQFGLITDSALCPDPQSIIDRFEPEFEQLLYLCLMLPWPGQA